MKNIKTALHVRFSHSLILLVLCSFYAGVACSLDLPFIGKESLDYKIEVQTEQQDSAGSDPQELSPQELSSQELRTILAEELEEQREFNLTLKEIENPLRIIRAEVGILERKLRSLGYYQAKVYGDLEKSEQSAVRASGRRNGIDEDFNQPETVVKNLANYTVSAGQVYRIDQVDMQLAAGVDPNQLPRLPVSIGQPLVAEQVFLAVDELTSHIAANYCFYDINIDYSVAVSHAEQLASVIFTMENSEQVTVGEISVAGAETIAPEFLTNKLQLKSGSCFKSAAVDRGRLALLRTNLLARVNTRFSQPAKGIVDVTYEVQERHHRTLSAGLGYSSDEDFNISAGWEHRNILGKGEKFALDTTVSTRTASVEGVIEFPDFIQEDLSLNLRGEGQLVDRNTFESESVEAGAELSYRFHPSLTFSVGSQVKYSDIRDGLTETEFYLISFPLRATWDRTNDLLDPTEGWVIFTEISPYIDVVNSNTEFIKTSLSGSAYHTFDSWLSPTLAVRLATGTIGGEPTLSIPADERFYVGGGGSVRGYQFQSLSQQTLNDDGELIRTGGSSFQELSAEFRFRINQDWGFVTFSDGGYAFGEGTPDLNEELFWGAGFGLRYYTLVAPLRFDIAFPLNRRTEDDSYQLYISLGQAF